MEKIERKGPRKGKKAACRVHLEMEKGKKHRSKAKGACPRLRNKAVGWRYGAEGKERRSRKRKRDQGKSAVTG